MNKHLRIVVTGLLLLILLSEQLRAQQSPVLSNLSGNFEINSQYYKPDSAILAPDVPEKLLSNGF